MSNVQNIEHLIERKRANEEQRRVTIEKTYELLKKLSKEGVKPEAPTILKQNSQSTYISEITRFIFTNSNVLQLQKWTNKRFTNVLFDSKEGLWSVGASDFLYSIAGKRNLVVAILDKKGNLFGGYVSGEISEQQRCGDNSTFLFVLPSSGCPRKPMKFDLAPGQEGNVFYVDSVQSTNLFDFGDLCVVKKGTESFSSCNQQIFEYNGESLIGNGEIQFAVNRIVVAEMADL